MILKSEKNFPLVCGACRDKSIDINILKLDQYSHLVIRLKILRFSGNNSKTNEKFEKSFLFVCRTCRDKSNDV